MNVCCCLQTCNSVVYVLVMWLVLGHSLMVISTTGVYNVINPRRACAARVSCPVDLSVCPLSDISPLELLFFLKTLSRTQPAMKVKIFVAFSLKPMPFGDRALPPFNGPT